jgi:hypothetical protein
MVSRRIKLGPQIKSKTTRKAIFAFKQDKKDERFQETPSTKEVWLSRVHTSKI